MNPRFDLIKTLDMLNITNDDIIKSDILIRLILEFYDLDHFYIDGIDIASPYNNISPNNNINPNNNEFADLTSKIRF